MVLYSTARNAYCMLTFIRCTIKSSADQDMQLVNSSSLTTKRRCQCTVQGVGMQQPGV